MNYNFFPTEQLIQIKLENISDYLLASGWNQLEDNESSKSIVFQHNGKKQSEIILAKKQNFPDYGRRITDAIITVSDLEEADPRELFLTLLSPASDILSLRIVDHTTLDGTVGFPEGINLLTGARTSLMASAHTVLKPQKYHKWMGKEKAEEFLKACRLGQTRFGSYIATIVCPLNAVIVDSSSEDSIFSSDPFTRRVTSQLLTSVKKLTTIITQHGVERLLREASDQEAFWLSANLCDGLVVMQPPSEDSFLSITPTWARTNSNNNLIVREEIKIPKSDFTIIEEISRELKPKSRFTFIVGS